MNKLNYAKKTEWTRKSCVSDVGKLKKMFAKMAGTTEEDEANSPPRRWAPSPKAFGMSEGFFIFIFFMFDFCSLG